MRNDLLSVPIGEVNLGDALLGWQAGEVEVGGQFAHRRWHPAIVEEVARRTALAVRATLSDGSSAVCTPDHHWWTSRRGQYEYQPLLKPQHRGGRPVKEKTPWGCYPESRTLFRVAAPVVAPRPFAADYMIGYIKGLADGEGNHHPTGGWRIAMADPEPLGRAAQFLLHLGMGDFDARPFSPATERHRAMQKLYFGKHTPATGLIDGPYLNTDGFWRGWLGGICDGEGTAFAPGGALRLCQYHTLNLATYRRIASALLRFGFPIAEEPEAVRLLGGVAERIRFAQLVCPAIPRKQNPLAGSSIVETFGGLAVEKVEAIGEVEVVSLRTSTGNYISNGFMSRNCFANRNRDANERELNPKNSAPALFRKIDRAIADPEDPIGFFLREKYPICFSNTTDPFQRDEKQYRASEAFLSWAKATGTPLFIQTRGADLLLDEWDRYAPLLVPGKDVVYLSICQMDDKDRKRHEPGAPRLERRWELACALADRGIPVVIACNPYLRDWVPDPDAFCARAQAAGARGVWLEALHFTAAQTMHLAQTYHKELLPKSNLLPMFMVNQLKGWYAATAARGLDFFPTPYWDAYHGCKARFPECADPAWLGGKTLGFAFDLVRLFVQTAAANAKKMVVASWRDVRSFLERAGIPNPTLKTSAFWYPFNNQVKADREGWNARLGKTAPFHEIIRYFWNHPWENRSLFWYQRLAQPLYSVADKDYVVDDDGDLFAVYNPKVRHHGPPLMDAAAMPWDQSVWLGAGVLDRPVEV